jgi:hypothetical protein
MGHLGPEHGSSPPERPKGTMGRLLSVAPDIISCENDVLPAKRRDVRDNRRREIDARALEFNRRLFEAACIPQGDRGNPDAR